MARKRGKSKPRRSRSRGINLIKLGTSVLGANIVTETMFNNDVWSFFFAGTPLSSAPRAGQGTQTITAYELLTWKPGLPYQGAGKSASRFAVVQDNLKENAFMGIVSLVALGVGEKVLRKSLRPLLRQGNQLLDMGGLKGVVSL
jgi:hypothetical protein